MSITDVHITGWAHSQFGKLTDETVESLIVKVTRDALADAGLEAKDVDEIYVGQFNSGMAPISFPSSLVLQADDGFRFTPATRVENACATGTAAVHHGARAIASGQVDTVLVVGVEMMTPAGPQGVGRGLLGADYARAGQDSVTGFAEIFADIAEGYFERFGDRSETLARIAASKHRNGLDNPYAQLRKDFGFEFCNTVSEKNPIVAGPLRRTDCSLVSDGAAALVMRRSSIASEKAVRFKGIGHANDFMPNSRRDLTEFEAGRVAWQQALAQAGIGVWDLDLIETHDCFTIAELIEYEMMGLAEPGKGFSVVDDGTVDKGGRLPVNVSGGLKSKGHPVGATGVSQHVLCSMQLTGQAGGMQVEGAELAGIYNMGGSAVANYASVLEAVK